MQAHGGRFRRYGGPVVVALVTTLLAAACSNTASGTTDPAAIPAGDAAAFCNVWPQARAALVDEFAGWDDQVVQTAIARAKESLATATAVIPRGLRADWDDAVAYQDRVIALLDIARWDPGNLRQELIVAAFGDQGPEAAAAAANEAIERLDAWSVGECGDFCEWWPRLNWALEVDEESMMISGRENRSLLVAADALVPDAIRSDWDAAASIVLAVADRWSAAGWFPPWEPAAPEEARVELAEWPELVGVTRAVCEAVMFDEQRGVCEEIGREARGPEGGHPAVPAVVNAYRDRIRSWAESNCAGAAGGSGLAGSVTVDGRVSSAFWFIGALAPGTTIDQVQDASDFVGVACVEPWAAGEAWEARLIARDSKFNELCSGLHRVDQGARIATLPAGTYSLFVASFPYGLGSWDVYLPAPDRCAVVPFTVDGDTRVTIAEPGPCDLDPLAGSAEEIARRQPASLSGPTGTLTLRVTLTDTLPDGFFSGQLWVGVLPAGTTLNEVGRGEAWLAGGAGFGFDDDPNNPEIRDRIRREGIQVPVFPYEAGEGFSTYIISYLDPDRLPAPAYLPNGEYTVYVHRVIEDPEAGEAIFDCATFPATVDGDTTVTAPSLEPCR